MIVWIVIIVSVLYFAILFGVAAYSERQALKGKSIISNPYAYALSLAVFCTAWTFYGSVGRAATTGVGFLPTYLGPTLLAPIWIVLLKKMIVISKHQRTTSIADFISARYGKSTPIGVLVTLVAVFGVIPYIAVQLQAVAESFNILISEEPSSLTETMTGELFYLDTSLYIAIALILFTILFGTRRLETTEGHEGLVAAIAFESIVKLFAFLAVGVFVTYGIYGGITDVFAQAMQNESISKLITFEQAGIDDWEWTWLIALSTFSILLLPRQFHVAVIENTNPHHVDRAMWLFPLYLLLINIFVLPIAFGGLLHFPDNSVAADSFVLKLPLIYDQILLSIIVFLGGLSAATSMIIVATIALSIMVGNNIILPLILKVQAQDDTGTDTFSGRNLINIRRIVIAVIIILAYIYFKAISGQYSLVSLGLISFVAVAQFAPALIGGMFWKEATAKGAFWGLMTGFLIWAYLLPLPTLVESNLISNYWTENGLGGIAIFKPDQFLGLQGVSPVTMGAFWSLFFNVGIYVMVSLHTTPTPIELKQADIFVDIYKYADDSPTQEVLKRTASFESIELLLYRFLGKNRGEERLKAYAEMAQINLSNMHTANEELISYVENTLTGAIGAASARILLDSVVKEDPISLEEVMNILDETQQILSYSKALEQKSKELEKTTIQLKNANQQLKELDALKDEFITTVTHELRTPITSIKALSRILFDDKDLSEQQKEDFLAIVVNESERIARLVNQVLDIEKIQNKTTANLTFKTVNLHQIIEQSIQNVLPLIQEKKIDLVKELTNQPIEIKGNRDKLMQVVINLLSNAIKFCDAQKGQITVTLKQMANKNIIQVKDNGKGIEPKNQSKIFDRFTQINDAQLGKPQGSGLGLFISKTIIEQHQGTLSVESQVGKGATFIIQLPV